MGTEQTKSLPVELQRVLEPLMGQVVSLTERIKEMDRKVEQIAREDYPETALLQQVKGVGPLIALTFILTLDDKARFQKSRDVGCYAGLRPRRSESGESQPQLRITKEGDAYLRKMLVQGAHYILGYRGPDTDLRRWGLKLAARGGKRAKKAAVVAVARKLGVLLHRLRSEEHTSELQSRQYLVCRLLLEKKKKALTQRIYCHVLITTWVITTLLVSSRPSVNSAYTLSRAV